MSPAAFLRYLALPLRPAPVLLIAIFSVLTAAAWTAGLLGLPLALITLSWFFKYAFVLMDHVADGVAEPPALSLDMVNPATEQRPLGLLLLAIAFYFVTRAIGNVLPGVDAALELAGMLFLPAFVAAMGATGRFFRGLNPVLAFGLVRKVPGAYLALLVVIALLWLGIPAAAIGTGIAGAVPKFLLIAVLMYLWLAVFACIGGLLYEHRDELGLEPSVSPERTGRRRDMEIERERDRIMDGIFAQWRGAAHVEALDVIRKRLDFAAQPLNEFRWLYARAQAWEDVRLAAHLARWAVPRLLEERATGELLDIVRSRLQADPDFRPATGAELIRVVRIAAAGGEPALARALLRDFERCFPGDPATAIVAGLREGQRR